MNGHRSKRRNFKPGSALPIITAVGPAVLFRLDRTSALGNAKSDLNDRLWATAVRLLFFPIAAGRLSGDLIGAGASERLKVVETGTTAPIPKALHRHCALADYEAALHAMVLPLGTA